jgi:hypothetical protein
MGNRTLIIVLAILVFGSVGTVLSTFYLSIYQNFVVYKTSYGFPIGWHGHDLEGGPAQTIDPEMPIDVDWFSLESLLLDIAFWFAISSITVVATIKAVNMLHKRRMERTQNTNKNRPRKANLWFCGKVIAEPKATVSAGDLNCLKVRLST